MPAIPFPQYLRRLWGKQPEPALLEALHYIPGEAKIRELGASGNSARVRAICRMITSKLDACERAKGKEIRIDTGEECRTYAGVGRVLYYGNVLSAVLVVVEDESGKRGFAYDVVVRLGRQREDNGAFRKRNEFRGVIDSLPVTRGKS